MKLALAIFHAPLRMLRMLSPSRVPGRCSTCQTPVAEDQRDCEECAEQLRTW
jgi:predicted amidophosphoribosyltransferase